MMIIINNLLKQINIVEFMIFKILFMILFINILIIYIAMEFLSNVIIQLQNSPKLFLIDFGSFISNNLILKSPNFIIKILIKFLLVFVYLIGFNLADLCCIFIFSLIFPLVLSDLLIFLQNIENIEFELKPLELIVKNPMNTSAVLSVAFGLCFLYTNILMNPIRIFFILLYYFKAIYPLANMTEHLPKSLICSSISLGLIYIFYYKSLINEIITSFLYSVISSIAINTIIYQLDQLEIKRIITKLISIKSTTGDQAYGVLLALIGSSLLIQQIIKVYIRKKFSKSF